MTTAVWGWRAARGIRRLALWLGAGAFAAGCGGAETDASASGRIFDRRLASGQPIRELLAADRPNALLVYSTEYAFSCTATLNQWRELDRAGRVNLLLVLTDEPTDADRRDLLRRRIKVAGVLAGAPGARPREYLIDGKGPSVMLQTGSGTGQKSPVLRRFTQGT